MGLAAKRLREVTWAYELFPSMREFALDRRPSLAEMQSHLPGSTLTPIWFRDLSDASVGALCAHPEAMLDPATRRQTSFCERLERDHPDALRTGLRTLRNWLAHGHDPRAERRRMCAPGRRERRRLAEATAAPRRAAGRRYAVR